MATISLVMIVKNEERALRRCLENVKPIVDEFVICDTGSTDGTQAIIREYAATQCIFCEHPAVHELPFEDYVTTKNKALALAHGDYVLFMDADEYVLSGLDKLKAHAEQGADCVMAHIAEGSDTQFTQTYYRARLWKNNGQYHFDGPGVHETLMLSGNVVYDDSIIVRHDHAYRDAEASRQKWGSWRAILEDYLAKHPGDSRAMFYLARTLRDLNFPLLAVAQYEAYLRLDTGFKDERWQAAYDIAQCYKMLGEYDLAREACDRAIQIDPRRAEAWTCLGLLRFREQDWNEAAKYFEHAVGLPIPSDVILFLDPRMYRDVPLEHLAICYDRTQQYRKSLDVYNKLIALEQLLTLRAFLDKRVVSNLRLLHQHTRKKIFFALGHTPEPVYGGMIERQGVGGVETTYVELPVELARMGHDVFVFCRCDSEHVYRNVNFIPYSRLAAEYARMDPDRVITSRWFDAMYVPGVARAKKIIWLQDSHFADPNYTDAWDVADAVVVSSPWHKQYIAERFGHSIRGDKLNVIPLGIRKALYTQVVQRDPLKVIYSSNPDRGLFTLMAMWDELTEKIPGIHLAVTYGWEGLQTWDSSPEWQQKIERDRATFGAWANQVGNVRFTGRLKKSDLAREQLGATLCLYPNNFWETFCLTALEMQAAGVPTITSAMGALQTTLCRNGNVLLRHDPFSREYREEFISATVDVMSDRTKLEAYALACRNHALAGAFDWPDIAECWENLFFSMGKKYASA